MRSGFFLALFALVALGASFAGGAPGSGPQQCSGGALPSIIRSVKTLQLLFTKLRWCTRNRRCHSSLRSARHANCSLAFHGVPVVSDTPEMDTSKDSRDAPKSSERRFFCAPQWLELRPRRAHPGRWELSARIAGCRASSIFSRSSKSRSVSTRICF